MPPVTQALLGLNVVVFALQGILPEALEANFALWPLGPGGGLDHPAFQVWQLVSYGFLHGSLLHLGFNMLALWMFGRDVEGVMGTRRFLQYYLTCVVTAAVVQLATMKLMQSPAYPTVGASGGVFGLLLAFGLLFPRRVVMLLIPPVPLPARVFVVVYGVIELVLGVTETQSGVAHFAHLGGLLGGWLMMAWWRGRFRRDARSGRR